MNGIWIKTPSGSKLYNISSIGISGKCLIYNATNNHEIMMEYPSEDYAREIMNLIMYKISNNETALDLATLRLPDKNTL